ncbi:MAG: putative nucleotidyltransferase [Paenibacillus sp.]|nr:putative nucleotidyltransferase [Paenibacillus sp.]
MERVSMEMIRSEIQKAEDCDQLRRFRDQLHEEFEGRLLLSHIIDWNRELNQLHDLFIAKAVELAKEAVRRQGGGEPPEPFAFVLFGSGGRGEQTLWSDQDNGLIYANPEHADAAEEAERYFTSLAEKISELLMHLGYPPCTGGVICTNEKWRRPWDGYRSMLYEWMQDPHWEHIRYLLILADMRPVYGEASLVTRLLEEFYGYVRKHPAMLEHMLHNTLHHKISLGLFGQLIKERYGEDAGGVDIKYGAYIPIVNGIRLLAVEAGLMVSSTEARITGLLKGGFVEEEIAHDWLEALSIALKLRSLTPFQIEDGHYTTRGKLPADSLTKERTSELKLCLRIGNDLQKYVKKSVHKEMEKG